jgi:hypothetical protein
MDKLIRFTDFFKMRDILLAVDYKRNTKGKFSFLEEQKAFIITKEIML